jgi:hypothetical protein
MEETVTKLSISVKENLCRVETVAAKAPSLKHAQVGVFDGTLEERIAAAFGKTNSGDVAVLIAEAETAFVVCSEAAEAARSQALNPALCANDVAAARHQMEDAGFRRDRMQEAVRRLGERLREVKAQEDEARRLAAYTGALTERDKLAAELAEVYPAVAEKLADLASRIARNDAEIESVNLKLPDGGTWIAGAEMIARQVQNFNDINSAAIPRITLHLRLRPSDTLGSTRILGHGIALNELVGTAGAPRASKVRFSGVKRKSFAHFEPYRS